MSLRRKPDDEILDEIVRESREYWVPVSAKGASRVAEERLLGALDDHDRSPSGKASRERRFWAPLALVAAIAAGVFLYGRGASTHPVADRDGQEGAVPKAESLPQAAEAPRPTAPGELAAVTEGGDVRVDGVVVEGVGEIPHDGQTVAAHGGQAVFSAPGRVSWVLENGTEVGMLRAGTHGGAIILALREGAVEAQVTPVPQGEAFAVDVDGVRVAVHGTHLRVARKDAGGTRVVVDLSEGVISVGDPPKAGSTVGTLVTAPAHVEFSVQDLAGTLNVDHDPAHVRAPVDPLSLESQASKPRSLPPEPAVAPPAAPVPAAAAPHALLVPAPKPLSPSDVVLAAARRCAGEARSGATNEAEGEFTISSTLSVDVSADGKATLASFDPPLAPELQSCVSKAVYDQRWSDRGRLTIPIEIHR